MKAAGGQTALMSRYPPRRENGRTRPWLGEAGEGSLVGLDRRCWPPVLALPGVGTGARAGPERQGVRVSLCGGEGCGNAFSKNLKRGK